MNLGVPCPKSCSTAITQTFIIKQSTEVKIALAISAKLSKR
jgi:hypothetical protein